MVAVRSYFPNNLGLLEPSPDGTIWLGCGHPKTPANTQRIGHWKGKPQLRCRFCRQKIAREDKRRRRERDKEQRRRKRLDG